MKIYRLGKHAPTLKKKTLRIGDFLNLSVLPTPPAGRRWHGRPGRWRSQL